MKTKKSYLVIGMGRFGTAIATELCDMNHEVMIVDEHEKNVASVMRNVTGAIIGDAKDEVVLRSLGINNFDGVIIAIARQEDSILVNMMVKEMGAKSITSKAQNELHEKILTLIGVDRVVRPEYEMGRQIAHSMDNA